MNEVLQVRYIIFIPMNEIIKKVALSTNSHIVDFSHLTLLDSENYARDEREYPGNKAVWKASGIGMHPGDKGMKNIAQELFLTIMK